MLIAGSLNESKYIRLNRNWNVDVETVQTGSIQMKYKGMTLKKMLITLHIGAGDINHFSWG